ncbi:helix-turn-helix domain-containing protein [Halomonas sp. 707B3]|uniref:helix-turn-helix domain-containing protein n=1 Tax=Halomonas sp. 707B3 TaxID=1681043 RepID=UPI0020A116B7|nr:helix-turn-helix domain-containing protein [Halomonas sp. 707B3]MCP1317840.1 helix-turn-helix domain-containing protein [Halomonas sp. 707B3]
MAAKMNAKQWHKARKLWEADPREGFAWLVRELSLPVSRVAVSKRAKADEWQKQEQPKGSDSEMVSEAGTEVTQGVTVTPQVTQEVTPVTNDRGRPSEYQPEYAEQAYRLMLLGMTRNQIAEFFEVSEATIYNWCHKYPDFLESIRRGSALADAHVAEALYKRAIGVVLPETHVAQHQGQVILTDLHRHYPPDTQAARLWLKNRQPELWKDKVEVEEKPAIALVDKEALDGVYREALEHAARVEQEMKGRAERLGLVFDHDDTGSGAHDG